MLRVGVIGAGAWGANHVRVVASEPGCVLAGVADPDPAARDRVRALVPDARMFGDADQLLAEPLDAVVIASPAPTHAAIARAALNAGKHILVEKPLAMSTGEASALAELARARARIGMVGHLLVYHPAVVRLRALLRSDELGALRYVHSTRINLGRVRQDENVLWSFGPHDLSMFDYLLERAPVSVSARGKCVLRPNIADVVFLTLRYPGGELANVHLSWLSPRKERRLTLVCSGGIAELDDVAPEKLRITHNDGEVTVPELAPDEPLRLQWRDFVTAIASGHTPVASLDSGVRVSRVLEAAQVSLARDGVPVDIAVDPTYAQGVNVAPSAGD